MKKVLLFNPRSNNHQARLPNSILQVAAAIHGIAEWVFVDGNLEKDPWVKIEGYLRSGLFGYLGCTVMPGPQLAQAIPISKKIRAAYPDIKIVWGGYFASNQAQTVLQSGYVDVVVDGPGDRAFPLLLQAFDAGLAPISVPNIIFHHNGSLIKTPKDSIYDQDSLPELPYERLHQFYPVPRYLGKSFLGTKTIAYHSSFGCPFTCSFCAVVPIYNGKWRGQSAARIYKTIKHLKETYGGNAIEFHDNNFFVNEKRTADFAAMIASENMSWWGEGRIDTLHRYADTTLYKMRDAGCRMIFFGAETGNDAVLKQMDKGGKQTGAEILAFAKRMKQIGIIPEYSFVLGTPAPDKAAVRKQIDEDIQFIKKVKEVNPDTEIVIYVYSPVATVGSDMFQSVLDKGFRFPENLDDWLTPAWKNFDLRKNPLTPWLDAEIIDRIRNFETVLNGQFPTITDTKLQANSRRLLSAVSSWRYHCDIYHFPYEIKALQKILRYRQPETEGF